MKKLGELSNEELLTQLRGQLGKGHVWQTRLVAYLAEVEHRQLFLEHACPSMWEFCVRKLGMSESEANLRIAAGRVVRQFPRARGYLEEGRIHLCAIYALRKHLTDSNHEELLREALGKTTREVEQMVAARFPKPDVRPRIEPVAPQGALPIATSAPEGGQSGADVVFPVAVPDAVLDAAPAAEPRPVVMPLSATRYHVELTVSSEVKSKLERIKDLMRHRNPTGDLETVIDIALDLLLAKLEKERLGKTSRPRRPTTTTSNTENTTQNANTNTTQNANANTTQNANTTNNTRPGYISRETRRQVFARDGEQCTYLDADGNRCPARAYLELDHIHPTALGGSDAAENIRVRCRAHNQHYAEQVFGRPYVQARIHLGRRKNGVAAAATGSFEVAAKGLRSMGFREAEVSRAIAMLASKLDYAGAPIESIIREALLVLT